MMNIPSSLFLSPFGGRWRKTFLLALLVGLLTPLAFAGAQTNAKSRVSAPRVNKAAAAMGATSAVAPQPELRNGNDLFANAYVLSGLSGSVTDNNVGATKEPGEPNHAGNIGGASVWYTWTALASTSVTFSTAQASSSSAIDTVLAVYVGTDVASLAALASDDDNGSLNSKVTFDAQANVTYRIAVDGYNSLATGGPSKGSFILTYNQQPDPLSPTITSGLTASGQVNTAFSYAIAATNNPTIYGATGLPDGLSIKPSTGIIFGTPTTAGQFTVTISATNSHGTGTAQLVATVASQAPTYAFFSGEIALPQSPGVYYLHLTRGNIFGYYAYLQDRRYIYHFDLGYEYIFDANDNQSGVYLYDFASDTFFYTSPSFPFPYLYDFKLKSILYYYPNPTDNSRYNTNGVRYFYNFSTRTIITK